MPCRAFARNRTIETSQIIFMKHETTTRKSEANICYKILMVAVFLCSCSQAISTERTIPDSSPSERLARKTVDAPLLGLNGQVSSVHIAIPADSQISFLSSARLTEDIDLKRMAD